MLGSFRRSFDFDFNKPLLKEQAFVFSSCYSILEGRHDYELAIEMLANSTIPVKNMVTHTYTLDEIQMVVGGSQPAISARLRDLRKARYGSLQVDRKHRPSVSKMRGLYEYRLVLGRGVKRTT